MARFLYRESRSPKSGGKRLERLIVKTADDGGHIVEHHYAEDGMEYHKPYRQIFGKDEGAEMLNHVAKHMKVIEGESE